MSHSGEGLSLLLSCSPLLSSLPPRLVLLPIFLPSFLFLLGPTILSCVTFGTTAVGVCAGWTIIVAGRWFASSSIEGCLAGARGWCCCKANVVVNDLT